MTEEEISIENMAEAYLDERKMDLENMMIQVQRLEEHIAKLVPFNDYRQFALTNEKDLPALLEERKIRAIATADSKTDSKSLAEYEKFNKNQNLVVLKPLLLYPEKKKANLLKLFAN